MQKMTPSQQHPHLCGLMIGEKGGGIGMGMGNNGVLGSGEGKTKDGNWVVGFEQGIHNEPSEGQSTKMSYPLYCLNSLEFSS